MLPATFALLADALRNGQKFTVEARKPIHDFENYLEPGMRVEIVGVEPADVDDVIKIKLDYTKFDEYNQQFESSNYYDKKGIPCLNARQSGDYKVQDVLYTDVASDPNYYFKHMGANPVYEAYQRDAAGQETYVQYLERLVLESWMK